nr:hypothetical protein [Micromonospora sp. DSM 115978]
MLDELAACEQLVLADPAWQAAMRRRGVSDFSLAMVDLWSAGYTGAEDNPTQRRIVRPLTFVRAAPGDNGYARPVEGLIVVVDLDAGTVVEVADHGAPDHGADDHGAADHGAAGTADPEGVADPEHKVVPLPPRPGNYAPALLTADPLNVPAFDRLRDDLRPIEITQPAGASFTVDGHAVTWQKW